MAKIEYRKIKGGSDTWHWCQACTNWPTKVGTFETWIGEGRPPSGELDNQCKGKEKDNNCRPLYH
jgi:hypothetical protein